MTEAEEMNDETKDAASAQTAGGGGGDVGDLETAGETTAAEMIGGGPDTRPVGVDTMADIKISDSPTPSSEGDAD